MGVAVGVAFGPAVPAGLGDAPPPLRAGVGDGPWPPGVGDAPWPPGVGDSALAARRRRQALAARRRRRARVPRPLRSGRPGRTTRSARTNRAPRRRGCRRARGGRRLAPQRVVAGRWTRPGTATRLAERAEHGPRCDLRLLACGDQRRIVATDPCDHLLLRPDAEHEPGGCRRSDGRSRGRLGRDPGIGPQRHDGARGVAAVRASGSFGDARVESVHLRPGPIVRRARAGTAPPRRRERRTRVRRGGRRDGPQAHRKQQACRDEDEGRAAPAPADLGRRTGRGKGATGDTLGRVAGCRRRRAKAPRTAARLAVSRGSPGSGSRAVAILAMRTLVGRPASPSSHAGPAGACVRRPRSRSRALMRGLRPSSAPDGPRIPRRTQPARGAGGSCTAPLLRPIRTAVSAGDSSAKNRQTRTSRWSAGNASSARRSTARSWSSSAAATGSPASDARSIASSTHPGMGGAPVVDHGIPGDPKDPRPEGEAARADTGAAPRSS